MAVGGFGSTSNLPVCVCVFVSWIRTDRCLFLPAHRIRAKRAVRHPLTSSDRRETHRREVAALESDSDRTLLPWIQDSHQFKPLQSGSNLMQVNCKITTTHG